MRILLQKVSKATVSVDDVLKGAIEVGYCLLIGITHTDTEVEAQWLANKIVGLRLFEDENGKMNHNLKDVSGHILAVSQFTLYGNVERGRRPSFDKAAPSAVAEPLYEQFIMMLRHQDVVVETGCFGEKMDVTIHNDGPVTLMLERG